MLASKSFQDWLSGSANFTWSRHVDPKLVRFSVALLVHSWELFASFSGVQSKPNGRSTINVLARHQQYYPGWRSIDHQSDFLSESRIV